MAKEEVKMKGMKESDEGYWNEVERLHSNFVRLTQPSADEFDNTAMQDTPHLSQLIMFATARAKQWQMLRLAAHDMTKGRLLKSAKVVALVTLNSLMVELLKMALKGTGDDDEPEEIAKTLAVKTGASVMSNWLIGGEIANKIAVSVANSQLGTNVYAGSAEWYMLSHVTDTWDAVKAYKEGDYRKSFEKVVSEMSNLGMPAEGMYDWFKLGERVYNSVEGEETF